MKYIESMLQKFSVNSETGCWEWTGCLTGAGYSQIGVEGRRVMYAHRLSHQFFIGPIPDGYEVDHLCFKRNCINPDHLEAVTPSENVRRARRRKPECPNGHPWTDESTGLSLGKYRFCKICKAINDKEFRKAHIEASRARSALWRQKNREQLREYFTAYREKNREKLRDYHRERDRRIKGQKLQDKIQGV